MKNSLLAVLVAGFLFGFNRVSGQALVISPGDTFSYVFAFTDSSSIITAGESDGIVTNNWQPDTICWKLTQLSADSGWSLSMCDPVTCYYYTSVGANQPVHRFPIDTGVGFNQIKLGSSPNCVAGSGEFHVLMWLQHDSAASATVIVYKALYTGVCGATAIPQITSEHLKIYPTPVNQQLTVEGLAGLANANVYLYDMLGNTLIREHTSGNQNMLNLNTSDLNPGIYIVAVEAGGARVMTRRIEKLD